MILKEIAQILLVKQKKIMLFYLLVFCGKEYETKCYVSSLVCVVYIGIYKIGCNIYAKNCLLAENVSIEWKCVCWLKMCLLAKKMPIE